MNESLQNFSQADNEKLVSLFAAAIKQQRKLNPAIEAEKILKKEELIFVKQHFLRYHEGCYKILDDCELNALLKDYLGKKYSTHTRDQVKANLEADCLEDYESLNKHDGFLNCTNGMLEIRTGKLLKYSPEYLSTQQIAADYKPGADCPRFKKFLSYVLYDDLSKIEPLQEYFGYALTNSCREEKMLFLVGERGAVGGMNGKSVTLDCLEGLLGRDNVSALSLRQIGNDHYTPQLLFKMLNRSTENDTQKMNEAVLKIHTSGEPVEADKKFKDPFRFSNTAKFAFCINNLPHVSDKTDSFYRRLLLIPFNRKITNEERNKNLAKQIISEDLSGILNWALEGLMRLESQNGFSVSRQVSEALESYRRENNSALNFIHQSCVLEVNAEITKRQLYEAYGEFCKQRGVLKLGEIKFGKQVRSYCGVVEGKDNLGNHCWKGLKLSEQYINEQLQTL